MGNSFDIFSSYGKGFKSPVTTFEPKESLYTMTKLQAEQSINDVDRYCKRAVSSLKTAHNTPYENVEYFSSAVYLLEQAIQTVRGLAAEYEHSVVPIQERPLPIDGAIKVWVKQKWIEIELPMLMPKRVPGLRTAYYTDSIRLALDGKNIPKKYQKEKIAISFLHCYKADHALWAKRDHDNLEVKWIIDALNDYFFIDDGPFRTSLFHQSVIDKRDKTLIYLVPQKGFTDFLAAMMPRWEWETEKRIEEAQKHKKVPPRKDF